jgi:hypothetical protein
MAIIKRRKIFYNNAYNPQEQLFSYNRPAVITNVDTEQGVCSLNWLDNPGGRVNVLLTQGSWGEYNMPVQGAIVLVQFDKHEQARIVRYVNLNQAARQKPTSEGGYGDLPKLKPGEKFWESSGGAFIYMTSDGRILLSSPFDDTFEIDPNINLIKGKTVNWKIVNAAGNEYSGQVKRYIQEGDTATNKIITDNVPTSKFPDGTPLTEYNLIVNDKYQSDSPICKITIGSVVDNEGKVKDKDGNVVNPNSSSALALKLDINSNYGSLSIVIDKSGKFYITSPKIVNISNDIKLGSNDATEKAVLGNKLKEKLENLIDSITNLTVPTAFGPSGTPINSSSFISIKNELLQILSEKVTLE